ncbi:hypothetical protein DFH08DRAFT_819402 [Mycena albidolilacea]|uniref:HD domain-containing protein n=1 Tax=Mycena albidolilacea TaxID=1033008 RepID=A0AAD7EGA1_9AGAR|nr:hypothetical protein DFH08DRAFT_819402 [Mycena albidolilacea]
MTFPSAFDAFVPSNGPEFLAASTIQPTYVPFTTLSAVPIDTAAHAASFAYAKKLSPPGVFLHVVRCFYFALALLYTGFPSGTPGVPQIGFEELSMRLYHTTLLHDLGWSNSTEVLNHPAHAMTFELHGGFMAYEHLHTAAPDLDADQVGDIVQSIVLHTLQWSSGNSSATQILMSVSALFDIGGYNGTGIAGLDYKRLWHPKTIEEIEKAYPRGEFYHQALAAVDREFTQKPNCLASHFPGGLEGFTNEFRVGPIVPEDSRARNVRGLKALQFRDSEQE